MKVINFQNIFLVSTVALGITSCLVHCNTPCYKSSFNNKTFSYLYDNDYNEKNFIIFLDSIQLEFLDDNLVLRNRVHWMSCSEYLLIVEEIFDKTMYREGDTISNKITGFRGDSVYLFTTGKGITAALKILQIDRNVDSIKNWISK